MWITTVAGDQKRTIRDKSENRETILAVIGAGRAKCSICEYEPMADEKRNLITMKAALAKGGFKRTKAYELINHGKIFSNRMRHHTRGEAARVDAYHRCLLQM